MSGESQPKEGKRRQARLRRRKKAQGQGLADPNKRRAARKRRGLRRKRAGEKATDPSEKEEHRLAASALLDAHATRAPDADPKTLQLMRNLEKWRPPLHADGFPLIVMWTPKAGCTTLVKWFLFQSGLLDTALAYDPWPHQYRQDILQAGPDFIAKTASLLLEGKRPIFKLVRDPRQRAVSSFLQLCLSIRPGRETWASRTIQRLHRTIDTSPLRETISFREYARALALGRSRRNGTNPHIAEQYSEGEDELAPRLIRLENFTAEIRAIEAEFNLNPAPLDEMTSSGHHRGSQRMIVPGAADMQASLKTFPRNNAPAHESFYDAEIDSLIATAFRRDFERYGYAPDRLPQIAA